MISLGRTGGTDWPPNPKILSATLHSCTARPALQHSRLARCAAHHWPELSIFTCSMATAGHPIPSFEPATQWPSFTCVLWRKAARIRFSYTIDRASAFVATNTAPSEKGHSTASGRRAAARWPLSCRRLLSPCNSVSETPLRPCVRARSFFSPAIASAWSPHVWNRTGSHVLPAWHCVYLAMFHVKLLCSGRVIIARFCNEIVSSARFCRSCERLWASLCQNLFKKNVGTSVLAAHTIDEGFAAYLEQPLLRCCSRQRHTPIRFQASWVDAWMSGRLFRGHRSISSASLLFSLQCHIGQVGPPSHVTWDTNTTWCGCTATTHCTQAMKLTVCLGRGRWKTRGRHWTVDTRVSKHRCTIKLVYSAVHCRLKYICVAISCELRWRQSGRCHFKKWQWVNYAL